MPEESNDSACRFCAQIDFVADTPEGLDGIHYEEAEAIMLQLMRKLSFDDLVVRATHSDFPDELFSFLVGSYVARSAELVPAAHRILRDPGYFSPKTTETFARRLWLSRVRERKNDGDLAGAWRTLKIARLGSTALNNSGIDYVLPQHAVGEPVGLICPLDATIVMVPELHRAFFELGLVSDVIEYDVRRLNWGNNPHWPAGIDFAIAIGGCRRDEAQKVTDLTSLGIQVFSIAECVGKMQCQIAA